MSLVVAGFFLCATAAPARAQSASYAVQISATTQESPPRIVLSWPLDNTSTGYTVHRKTQAGTSWGSAIANLAGSATGYTDSNVTVGSAYEYQITRTAPGVTAYGYIFAGIQVPLVENRGKVVLVVDSTYAPDLATELNRLQRDLVGDGWTVIRHDVLRTASVTSVRNLIKAEYNADPNNVKAVFIFGRVPVPYSGDIAPDGHNGPNEHRGAWPADSYYAELTGNWTDSTVNSTTANETRIRNVPGDGKFDQSEIPTAVELQSGRVDLFNMPGKYQWNSPPSFPVERELLRQYLNKDHAYRHKLFSLQSRGILHDGTGPREGEAHAANGWRAFPAFFGPGSITVDDNETYLQRVTANSYLWSYVSDAGDYNYLTRVGGSQNFGGMITAEMVAANIKTCFAIFYGSWLGDWDSEDNIMRGVLACPSNGLAAVYGAPHWFFHHLALGEPFGYSVRLTQNNNDNGGLYQNQVNPGDNKVHIALMGDPTLRLFPVAPPAGLSASIGSSIGLNWTATPDSILGYHVYRAANPNGPFTRLTGSLITQTSYTDTSPPAGTNTYMVRAVKLQTTGSGTFFNPSQGVFVSAAAGAAPPTLTASADHKSRAYGSANPAFTGTLTGVQNGDNITAVYNSSATSNSAVGNYPIVPTLMDPDNKLPNYTVVLNNGTLSVTQAALTISADNKSRAYGAPNPTLTGSVTGLQNSDDITANYTTSATQASNAGSYDIIPAPVDPGGKLPNYNLTLSNATLTINEASLTVTADNKSRAYGEPNPTFTGALDGVQNGDNLTANYSTAAGINSPVGNYSIVPSLNDPDNKLGNYSVATTNGTLTVTATAPQITGFAFANDQFSIQVTGAPGGNYTLHATTNYSEWTSLLSLIAPGTSFELTDTNAGGFSERYYRVSTGP